MQSMGDGKSRIQFGTYLGPEGPRYVPNWILVCHLPIVTSAPPRVTMAQRSTVGSRLKPRSYSAPLSHRLHVNKVASCNLLYYCHQLTGPLHHWVQYCNIAVFGNKSTTIERRFVLLLLLLLRDEIYALWTRSALAILVVLWGVRWVLAKWGDWGADLEKNLFVSQAPFLRVEMCHQNSVIRDKNWTKKQCDMRHNLVPKH